MRSRLNFAITLPPPPQKKRKKKEKKKSIRYSDYILPFELLFRDVNSLNFSRFDKDYVKSRLRDCAYSHFKQVHDF